MSNIESIVRQINREFVPQFEEKLRAILAAQDREWLIEQIVRLTLDAHSLEEMDRKHVQDAENRRREERVARVKKLNLGMKNLELFLARYKGITREKLVADKLLKGDAPAKGGDAIGDSFRTDEGNKLLQYAKDMLFGLLFGDPGLNVDFNRTQRELLTLTVPGMKSEALNFMKATTEHRALGTWQDPKGSANDMRADNIVLEIEYGEIEEELIGNGIVTALKLINNLEVNEEILYGRMTEIEQSTLVSQKLMKIQ
ncbi:MAG: hypothetical protein K8S20_03040 [Chloroflexi bacterium]|nr:hypothetical protein [Chloroflexota bacterium]